MPKLINRATTIVSTGTRPKTIKEFVGEKSTQGLGLSVATMESPEGWSEPGQTPDFTETTIVLSGTVHVEFSGGSHDVTAGQAIVCEPGEWVRYSTPAAGGASYVSVCEPAFTEASAHRDA